MGTMAELPTRRELLSYEFGPFVMSVGFCPTTKQVCEIWYSMRGKSGTELDGYLYEMGVTASKLIQGEEVWPSTALPTK